MTPRVLMVGTERHGKGGIAAVIAMYQEAGLLEQVAYLPAYREGALWRQGLFYAGFLARLTWMLATQPSIELVHVHSASRGSFLRKSLAVLVAKAFGKKTLMHIHGAGFNDFYRCSTPFLQRRMTRLLDATDAIIALSGSWKADLQAITGNPNIHVVYNPTVLKQPVQPKSSGEVTFLFLGRLGERKGVYDIIEAARRLQHSAARIRLYGDGPVGEIQSHVQEAGVGNRVYVGGWIQGDAKAQALQTADVLILPSYNEGLPISVLEALAYGLPVIATPVGGIPEAVEDGRNGYLIAPGDIPALASRIETLAASPEQRRAMAAASYRLAQTKFDLDVIVQQLETVYDTLLTGHSAYPQPVG